ncbi:hypothetical protein IQ07DRAFT_162808 [Pyrenochaeta sp. DS3sAY3a]|nr:hypothetical protein IQ07DRAFT_162808 [Pyrenochaeta sp. DS3sAY3a]
MQLDCKYTFSYDFLRQYFGGIDFLTICYADRAFLVLNMHFHSIEIREILGSRLSLLDASQTVWELRRVYSHLPRHSYHVELVIDCVEAKVKAYNRKMKRLRNVDHRFDLEPILGCHETDKFLRQIFGRYFCNRGPHLYTKFSLFQDVDTGSRIKQWVLDVQDTDAYPMGHFPDPQRPFAPVNRNRSACRSNQKNHSVCHLKAYGSESCNLRSQTCSGKYKREIGSGKGDGNQECQLISGRGGQ